MGIRVAVVGVGRWGRNHVRALVQVKGKNWLGDIGSELEEVLVVDRDIGRAREVARTYGADGYFASVAEAASRHVDAFIIAVPTVHHHSVAMEALRYGDVFIEKPLAATLKEARDIAAVAEEHGRIVAVGHIERFNPVVSAVIGEIREEPPVYVNAQRIGPGPPSSYTLNLGVAHDLLIHDVDIANYLVGGLPCEVYARAIWEEGFPYEVEIVAMYIYEKNIIANIRASWRTSPYLKKRYMMIQTSNKVISFDYITRRLRVEQGRSPHRVTGSYVDFISAYQARSATELQLMDGRLGEPLILELLDFLNAVKRRRKPVVDLETGYVALKCVISAIESASRGVPLRITWNEIPLAKR